MLVGWDTGRDRLHAVKWADPHASQALIPPATIPLPGAWRGEHQAKHH